ncbi:putative transcription factor WD40-like family [Helianthus anomalus]
MLTFFLYISVGTNVGDIRLWEVGSREKLVLKNFKVWNLSACSMPFQAALVKDPAISVNHVIWSPDGSLFGKHIVQIYSYHGGDDVRQNVEIDAHVGGANDLAFSNPNKQLCVWDTTTCVKKYTFEGHEAPVYSVCPHYKENIQFIFSTALDEKIKAWLYDNMGSRVDYEAPSRWCTTMGYSFFSCGTSKDGESHSVEWNESEGAVKRTYLGFRKRSLGVVQFDTTNNRFLAAGDEFLIKYWDMDNVQLLTSVDADVGLSLIPSFHNNQSLFLIRQATNPFYKDDALLAVSAQDIGIKILANSDGLRLLRMFENLSFDGSASRTPEAAKPSINALSAAAPSSAALAERVASVGSISAVVIIKVRWMLNGDARSLPDVKPRIVEESNDKSKIWKLSEINEASQCRSLKLPENMRVTKATIGVSPQLWQPSSRILMTNDAAETNPEESVACFALSKNDLYVMSASGGKISLFNMMTFKVKSKLKGQTYNWSRLFSCVNVLVSSGADAQICVWSSDRWEKQKTRYIQLPPGRTPSPQSDTRVQFHHEQTHFLLVHDAQLAIYETTKLECVKQVIFLFIFFIIYDKCNSVVRY